MGVRLRRVLSEIDEMWELSILTSNSYVGGLAGASWVFILIVIAIVHIMQDWKCPVVFSISYP